MDVKLTNRFENLCSGCDGCEEWYHGDCIFVSEKEAKHIKHYYCQRCKENDPSLQTVFRAVPAAVPTIPSIPTDERLPKKQKEPKEKVCVTVDRQMKL